MSKFFDLNPISQTPDSTQTQSGSSFMEMNNPSFSEQQKSIMSTGFKNESLDSLVKVKTKKLRKKKKKAIKSYQYVDSDLIIKKDSFAFLQNIQNPSFTSFDPNSYILNTSIDEHTDNDTIVAFNQDVNVQSESEVLTNKRGFTLISQLENNHDSLWLMPSEKAFKLYTVPEISEYKQKIKTTAEENEITVGEDPFSDSYAEELVEPKPIKVIEESVLSSQIWLMGLLLGLLFLMAFIKFQHNSKLKTYLQSVLSYQSFYKMFKEQNATNQRLAALLSFIFFINISLVAYYTFLHFGVYPKDPQQYFSFPFIVGMVCLGYLIFVIVNKILAFVFESYKLLNENLYNLFFSNRILGLSLLPLVVLYPYMPPEISKYALYLLWGLVAGSFILRWFRGLQISFKHKVPYSYMFLYLCTLEIIPIIIIVKTILE